jgi:sugar phosphate isomerase/epimerase
MPRPLERREFLGSALAAGAALAGGLPFRAVAAAAESTGGPNPICAFIKFIQSFSYDELANAIAELGFDGIEATVRRSGYIEPAKAPDELPKLVDALNRRNLKVTMITTDVRQADDPLTEPVLRTAAALGIPMYRMGYYSYDLSRPVMPQLEALAKPVAELAALNRELGIQAVYQNHAGPESVGACVWDFYSLIKNLPQQEIALAFDICHATVEAGRSWPTVYNAMLPRIATVYVKDFKWDGHHDQHVPLGTGRVDRQFFRQLKADKFAGPISLHVEYLGNGSAAENIAALRRDLATLGEWLAS